jgi:hypothetical protein
VCAFQLCHQQCNSSRDCPAGERCVTSDRPFDVCQLASESRCTYNSQCPVGKMCASNGQCRDQCTTNRDCVMDQLCVTGVCADPVDITATGKLVGTPDDGGSGATCVRNSDCGDAGLVCLQGSCQAQCLADIDCLPPAGPGGTCNASVCVLPNAGTTPPVPDASIPPGAPAGYGQTCNLPSDCPLGLKCGNAGQCVYACNADFDCQLSGEGTCCNGHRCLTGTACLQDAGDGGPAASDAGICAKSCVSNAGCDDGVYCNGVERCLGGCCAPASDTPCNSHSACIAIACTESTKSCEIGRAHV